MQRYRGWNVAVVLRGRGVRLLLIDPFEVDARQRRFDQI